MVRLNWNELAKSQEVIRHALLVIGLPALSRVALSSFARRGAAGETCSPAVALAPSHEVVRDWAGRDGDRPRFCDNVRKGC